MRKIDTAPRQPMSRGSANMVALVSIPGILVTARFRCGKDRQRILLTASSPQSLRCKYTLADGLFGRGEQTWRRITLDVLSYSLPMLALDNAAAGKTMERWHQAMDRALLVFMGF
ncbi:MAG: hypothetical protein JO283_21660 [Bradyrhizobium sp.]|nr:hypothetical protein [Bradyrhizobium sp.]